jgi:hypothetical protein
MGLMEPSASSFQPSSIKDSELFGRHQPLTGRMKDERAENRSKPVL